MEIKIRKDKSVPSLISLNCTTFTSLKEKEVKTFPYISSSIVQTMRSL